MKFLSARRFTPACIVSVAAVAALAAPGVASASLKAKCAGANIEGQGSSLQADAQAVWDPAFNAAKEGCEKVTVKYGTTSSGKGFAAWQTKQAYGIGFIGTDNTVNSTEKAQIEAEGSGKVLTIPVLQGAVAVVVHLPENCEASSTAGAGKLAINNATLEGIYAGTVTKWSQLEGTENDNNKLTGAGCTPSTDTITPVVRQDGSGTTHIFKRYLSLIFNGSLASEDKLNHTWAELSEGSLSTTWPTAAAVVKAKNTGGGGLLEEVAAAGKAGSIGYANLADAVKAGFKANGSLAWLSVENSKKSKNGKVTRKFAEPIKSTEANCKSTVYSNGTAAFPPPSVDSPWNEVTTELASKTYSICGLTYDLILTQYNTFGKTLVEEGGKQVNSEGTEAEATTVRDFMSYVLSTKGGQKIIKGHDYSPLPKELINESKEGVTLIED
jgi:ABC-type phosphate transport system substrate-binding protein